MKKTRSITEWIRPELLKLSAYQVPDATGLIKLDAMENPYRWETDLVDQWLNSLREVALNRYPDAQASQLKQQLRTCMNIPESADIILGNGSDELILMLTLAFNRPEHVLLVPEPSFLMYSIWAKAVGMQMINVILEPENFDLDMFAMLEAIETHQPALMFLASPNNPTGNLFASEDIEMILETSSGIVVIDEAYAPFAGTTLMSRLQDYENLLIMRTVSKLGLAGLRLGFLVGSVDLLAQINKVRQPYNINALTQHSACFALQHYSIFTEQVNRIKVDRDHLFNQLMALDGVHVWQSQTNFLLFRVDHAEKVFADLKTAGILIKCVHGRHPTLDNCLQVTVGSSEDNEIFLSALTQSLANN